MQLGINYNREETGISTNPNVKHGLTGEHTITRREDQPPPNRTHFRSFDGHMIPKVWIKVMVLLCSL